MNKGDLMKLKRFVEVVDDDLMTESTREWLLFEEKIHIDDIEKIVKELEEDLGWKQAYIDKLAKANFIVLDLERKAEATEKLLKLYQLKDEMVEEYQVNDNTLERQKTLGAIRGIREEIQQLELKLYNKVGKE